MPRIELAPEVLDDLDRIFDHLARFTAQDAAERVQAIMDTLHILQHSPAIGRPVAHGMRELVLGQGSRGYVALYRHVERIDTVFILALRSQHEAGFAR